jgi:hypothetical protein
MDWNEFNKELQNRVRDPGTRYCLGIAYERILDIAKQMDTCASLLLSLAETMNNFVALNEYQDAQQKELRKAVLGEHEGVELRSVPLTNDDV